MVLISTDRYSCLVCEVVFQTASLRVLGPPGSLGRREIRKKPPQNNNYHFTTVYSACSCVDDQAPALVVCCRSAGWLSRSPSRPEH